MANAKSLRSGGRRGEHRRQVLGAPPAVQRIRPALSPLVYASIADNLAVGRVLVARGADLNLRCSWGTALMQACKHSPQLAEVLLAAGTTLPGPSALPADPA